MASSMTGFGRGTAKGKQMKYVVEVRSLNNRFCEVRINAPKDLLELENMLARQIKDRFARGKFEILLKTEPLQKSNGRGINERLIVQRWKELDGLRKRLGLKEKVALETVLNWNPPMSNSHPREPGAAKLFMAAAEEALRKLQCFREQEGKHLVQDIRKRTKNVQRVTRALGRKLKGSGKARIARMRERIQELIEKFPLDPERLETECAILAEKSDVTEELVRLDSHLQRMEGFLKAKEPVGRNLDFLVQELNREANTIGAKSGDIDITSDVVFLKGEIEKIREQAQNLE